MKRKLSIMRLKLNISCCTVALKFYELIRQCVNFLLNPKMYSVIMKIGGVCCILSGIVALIKGYANPVGAGITYLLLGWIFIISKRVADKEDI